MKQPPPGVFNRKTEMTLSLTTKSYFGTPVSEICPNNYPQTEHDAREKLRASRNKEPGGISHHPLGVKEDYQN